MTGRKLNTAWRAVVGIVCVAMLAFSVAVVGLWLKVTQLESQLAKEQRVSAALRQQTQELGQALRSCRQTHGRNCRRPARPTPTPQPPTAVASGAVTPAPRPTGSASAKPQPSRSPEPTRPPSASPSPSPSCVVSVSRICVTVRSPVPLTERPGLGPAHRPAEVPLPPLHSWAVPPMPMAAAVLLACLLVAAG